MEQCLRKILLKKSKGNSEYVGAAVSVIFLVIFMVCMAFLYQISLLEFNTSQDIKMVMTTYVKRAETQGCFTTEDTNNLKEELKKHGFCNIQVIGDTSTTKQPYGSEIKLHLKGDIEYTDNENFSNVKDIIQNLRSIFKNDNIGRVDNQEITLTGTSKY